MSKLAANAAALLAVVLIVIALVALANRNLQAAGFSFLSASLVIYIRETRLIGE